MDNKATVRAAFFAVTTLFFAWGFITSLNDPLVAAVKGIFTLSNVQAQLSAFAFFIAYGLVSFPAAALIARIKPVPAILVAIAMMALACLVMLGAANAAHYTLVLVGLFIMASGITILQVAANPLAAALGDPKGSHFRLTLSQTFNSFGTFIGPILGSFLFLKGVEVKGGVALTPAIRANALAGIDRAYFWVCGLLVLLLVFFWFSRRTVAGAALKVAAGKPMFALIAEAFASKWTLFGGLAIFLYVGAEVSIGTQMALFLNSDAIWGRSDIPLTVPFLSHVMGSNGVAGVNLQEAGKGWRSTGAAPWSAVQSVPACWRNSMRRGCSPSPPPPPARCAFTCSRSAASARASRRSASVCSTRSCSR
jgi:FHS family L-fucose permease-like MFS transporter